MGSWSEPVRPRVRVVEFLRSAVMVTVYQAKRPGEVGHVGYIPLVRSGSRPGGSAMR